MLLPFQEPGSRPAWTDLKVVPPTKPLNRLEELGEALYGWNCLPCHGPEGGGDGPNAERLGMRPRDFTRGLFRFKTSVPGEMPFDDDLFRTISLGIPSAGMPAFTKFTSDERWAIVAYVKTLSSRLLPDGSRRNHFDAWPAKTRADLKRRPDAPEISEARGAKLYLERAGCAQCHGKEGRGDGPSAAGLRDSFDRPIAVPDFARGEVLFKAGSRREDIYRVLTLGLPGTPMPSFAALSDRDRWDLAAYVVSLYKPIHPGEKVYLWKGCINCHTLGKGRHLGPDLAGVTKRRDAKWIRRWIKDPLGLIAEDKDAQLLLKQFGLPMPNLKLKDGEIDAVVDFLKRTDAETK